jgi:hypothetical protein
MKNLNFLFLLTSILALLFYGCKKSSDTPLAKARLLSFTNDQPVVGGLIQIYHNTIAEGNIDASLVTDTGGYFDFHEYDNVAAIPSKSGWWNPLDEGYQLRLDGAPAISDNVLYLIHQSNSATVIIHCDSVMANTKPA